MWDSIFPYVAALVPTAAVAVLFYFLVKAILEGDRRERLAQRKWEQENPPDTTMKDPGNSPGPGR